MIIREAKMEKLGEIMAFYEMMCRELASKDFLKKEYKGGFPSLEMVTQAIKREELFVGEEEGAIIAAYIMDHESNPEYNDAPWRTEAGKEQAVVLHALRVAPQYGGRGYAGMLIEHAAETARERGQRAIRLDCIEGNSVPHKMYLSHGFEYICTVEMYYEDIGEPRNFLLFERAL